jgi:putative N6-adenine-specific DNA methylase
MDLKTINKIVISCAPGLAGSVEKELEGLGFPIRGKDQKAVITEGTMTDVMLLNYKMRTANKILWHIRSFKASHPNQLFKNAIKIPWEDILKLDGYFSIDSFVKNNFINDTRFANLKLKDAIADRFNRKFDKRPDSGPGKDEAVIFMRWLEDFVELYLDTSGQSIAKHGYRKYPGPAPLMENLAASIINASSWNRKSHFINPMCGSGTLAIEAALMALHIFPGKFRKNFGFQHIQGFQFKPWYQLRDKVEGERQVDHLPFKIIATDINRKAASIARENAKLAGVDHLIDFKVCPFENTPVPECEGVVMMNPEYGERLGEIEQLETTYQEIGDFLKQKCSGYSGYVFTGNLELAKKVGLRTKSRTQFFNGKIECRLLEYELY